MNPKAPITNPLPNSELQSEPQTLETKESEKLTTLTKSKPIWLWALIAGAVLLVIAITLMVLLNRQPPSTSTSQTNIKPQQVDTKTIAPEASGFNITNDRVIINGQLQANGSLVLPIGSDPDNPVTGQIYIDQKTGEIKYFNGDELTTVGNTTLTTVQGDVITNVTNLSVGATLPQPLDTTDSPTFAGQTINGDLSLSGGLTLGSVLLTDGVDGINFTIGSRTFIFPSSGPANQQICTTGISCAEGGGQAVLLDPGSAQTHNGTTAAIYISGTNTGNLIQLQDSGTDVFTVSSTGAITAKNSSNSTTAFQVQPSGSTTPVLDVDTTNTRVGIGTNAPSAQLHITGASGSEVSLLVNNSTATGNILTLQDNGSTVFSVADGGATTLTSTLAVGSLGTADTSTYLCRNAANQLATCTANGAGAAYTQGGNAFAGTGTLGLTDNNTLNIITSNTTRIGITGAGATTITGGTSGNPDALTVNNSTSTGNILNLQDNGKDVVTVANGGATTFKNSVDSSSAFVVQNAAGDNLISVSTSSGSMLFGRGTGGGILSFGRSTDSNTINIGSANTSTGQTQTINIGAGTPDPVGNGKAVVTIGNTNGASSIALNSGSGGIALTGNVLQSGTGTFGTGTGAVSLNGDTTVASGKTLTVTGGTTSLTGTTSINANANNATNINTGTSNALVTIGGGSGTFSLQTTNIDISSAGAITNATGISLASGNFSQTGSGTFSTGTGAVSLNGIVTASDNASFNGSTLTIGDASTDAVTVNSNTWTFANDTNFALSGGVNGLSFDGTTFSVDATNNRIGIGTASPSYDLSFGTGSDRTISVEGTESLDAGSNGLTLSAGYSRSSFFCLVNGCSGLPPMPGAKIVLAGNRHNGLQPLAGANNIGGDITIMGGDVSGQFSWGDDSGNIGGSVNILGGGGTTTGGTGGSVTIDAGTGTSIGSINIGTSNASTVNIATGGGTTNIATGSSGAAVNIGSNSGSTISIGTANTSNGPKTINIGNNINNLAYPNSSVAITIGSATSTSTTTVQGGTGGVLIQTTSPGTITVGQSTSSNTISIGSANTTTGNTQTINIGAGTPAGTGKAVITIGNQNGASNVVLQAGTGGVDIGSATTGVNVTTAGAISDSDANLVLNDTVDIGSSTSGIRVSTTGSMLDINANIVLNDTVDIGSSTTGINVTTAGVLTDTDGNIILDDTVDIGSSTAGLNVTTVGVLSDIDGAVGISDTDGININSSVAGAVTIGNGSSTFSLQTTNIDISSAGAITNATGIAMANGNFSQSGSGTFSTGTGNIDLNGNVALGNGANPQGSVAANINHTFSGSTDCTFGCYGLIAIATSSNPTVPGILAALYGRANTAAASFTLNSTYGLYIDSAFRGTGSTITNNYGIRVLAQTVGSNDYGIAIEAAQDLTLWISSDVDSQQASAGITFGASKDTNIYRSAANTLKTDDSFSIANNLTVGDASSDAVTVNSNTWTFANATDFTLSAVVNGLSFDGSTFSVDATNDRIGIGTAAPSAVLHVTGATSSEVSLLINNGSATGNIANFQDNGTNVLVVRDGGNVGIKTGSVAPSYDLSFGIGADRTIGVHNQTSGNNAGNALTLQSGNGFGSGVGGDINLTAGNSGASSIKGGNIYLTAGDSNGGWDVGGDVYIDGGVGGGDGAVYLGSRRGNVYLSGNYVVVGKQSGHVSSNSGWSLDYNLGNTAANTAWTAFDLSASNLQGTTAVSTGSIQGLSVKFIQRTTVAGNNETVANFSVEDTNNASTDTTVSSILNLANNDTATGSQTTVTDGIKITGANIINGINLSGTFNTNLITSTNFSVTQAGAIVGVGVNAGSGLLQGTGGITLTGTAQVNASGSSATTIGNASSGALALNGSTVTLTSNGAGNDIILNSADTIELQDNTNITGNFSPTSASTYDLGSATTEFDELYVGDNNGIKLGLDQDAILAYDEAGDDRVELTGTGASLFIEDRLSLGSQTMTMSTDGAATENLTPTASYVELTGQDNAGDIVQIQTGSAKKGDMLIITNNDAIDVSIDQNATTKLSGGNDVLLTRYDVIMLIFDGTNWLQVSDVTNNS